MGCDIIIYHNPACGTSRNALAMIRASGEDPRVVDYLHNPPSAAELTALVAAAGLTPRAAARRKGTPYDEMNLDDPSLTDDQLIEAMVRIPALINRPFVVTALGVRLCRPSEVVLEILPNPHFGVFTKEDGEQIDTGSSPRS